MNQPGPLNQPERANRPRRAAGIDCGTNSIRLLVVDGSPDGAIEDVHREMRVVRLGQDVDRTGRLAASALERTRLALVDYAARIRALGAGSVRMVATSATRDAANQAEFVAMVQDVLGIESEVITGLEEARLSLDGAVAGLPGAADPLLLADIGGGSTEVVRTSAGEVRAYSMDVGCVRMTERHLHDDPPTAAQIEATVTDVRAALNLARAEVPIDEPAIFVGVAGTVTTIAALALGLAGYDPDVIHGATISAEDVEAVTARLLRMTHAERAALPVMHPGRVDVIGGGALVLRTLMREAGAAAVVASEHDILDGIAHSALRRAGT